MQAYALTAAASLLMAAVPEGWTAQQIPNGFVSYSHSSGASATSMRPPGFKKCADWSKHLDPPSFAPVRGLKKPWAKQVPKSEGSRSFCADNQGHVLLVSLSEPGQALPDAQIVAFLSWVAEEDAKVSKSRKSAAKP